MQRVGGCQPGKDKTYDQQLPLQSNSYGVSKQANESGVGIGIAYYAVSRKRPAQKGEQLRSTSSHLLLLLTNVDMALFKLTQKHR